MYTRSYQNEKREPPRAPVIKPIPQAPQIQTMPRESIPPGYSGTAILREGEAEAERKSPNRSDKAFNGKSTHFSQEEEKHKSPFFISEEVTPKRENESFFGNFGAEPKREAESLLGDFNTAAEAPKSEDEGFFHDYLSSEKTPEIEPRRRAKRFRVATKVTPSLFPSEDGDTEEQCPYGELNKEIRERDTRCIKAEEVLQDTPHVGESREMPPKKPLNRTPKRGKRATRLPRGHESNASACANPSPLTLCPRRLSLKERSFSIEELLLGGLILLLLNDGADDDVILIFGFLLFSGL